MSGHHEADPQKIGASLNYPVIEKVADAIVKAGPNVAQASAVA